MIDKEKHEKNQITKILIEQKNKNMLDSRIVDLLMEIINKKAFLIVIIILFNVHFSFAKIIGPGVNENPWIIPRVLKNNVIKKRVIFVKEFIVLLNQTKHMSKSGKVEEKVFFQWQDLRKLLMNYHLVPEYIWKNYYHHVTGMDIEGYIRLKNRERVRWLVRPGGLACVMWENGKVIYLVRELLWKNDGVELFSSDL